MTKIEVSEDALESVKSMTQKLQEERDMLLAALKQVSMVITMEHHLRPDYGWGEWLTENVTKAIAKVEQD